MIAERINEITAKVENEFSELNVVQLNNKHSSDQWSIGQCIEHLIVSNEKYIPALKAIVTGKSKQSFWEKVNPLTEYTGRQMIKTLGPNVTKKFKSPMIFTPSKSSIGQNIISDFKKHQDELVDIFMKLESGNLMEEKITSPVASLITLKVRDVLEIIIVHEERHMKQAMKLKNDSKY